MKNQIALIWMSAGNSYFDEKNIGKILKFADKNFQRVIILSPEKPAEHTFRAIGYPDNKTRRKAKLNANLLVNRAKRELGKIDSKDKFHFVDWDKEIINSPHYKKKYKEIIYLYKNNEEFRHDARETTKEVINDKFHNIREMEKAIDEAVLYLIEEFSFILACPEIYESKKVSYLYHQNWEIFEDFIKGKYDGKNRSNFAFVLTGIK